MLAEHGERLDPEALASTAALVERAVAQRLGWLLEGSGHNDKTGPLYEALAGPKQAIDLRTGLADGGRQHGGAAGPHGPPGGKNPDQGSTSSTILPEVGRFRTCITRRAKPAS